MQRMHIKRHIISILLATAFGILASACSTLPDTKHQRTTSVNAVPLPSPTPSAHAKELEDILAAEFTLQRQGGAKAAQRYLETVKETQSVSVAQRATSIAMAADDNQAILQASARWLTLQPDNAHIYPIRFRALLNANQTEQALALLEQALENNIPLAFLPTFVDQHVRNQSITTQLAQMIDSPTLRKDIYSRIAAFHLQFIRGNYEHIVKQIDKLIAQSPTSEQEGLLIIKAYSLEHTGSAKAAQRVLEKGLEDFPESDRLIANLLELKVKNGEVDSALELFSKAKLAPYTQQQVGLSIAQLLLEEGDIKRGILLLDTLPSDGGMNNQRLFVLAAALQKDGQMEQAINTLAKVFGNLSWKASELLVQWLYQTQQSQRVNSFILRRAVFDKEPAHIIGVADLHSAQKRPDLTLKLLNQALVIFPNSDAIRYKRAITLDSQNQWLLAIKDLKILVEQHPQDPAYINALGYTMMIRTPDQFDEALSYINQAYELDPNSPAIIDSMGWASYLQGDLTTAHEQLSNAWQKMEDAEIGAHYGEVLWHLGLHKQALDIWQQSLDLNNRLPALVETLEKYAPQLLQHNKG